jgi:predicted O-methyltransferase YrrM
VLLCAARGLRVEHKIDLRLGPAVDSLQRMIAAGEGGTYDFAFIDADKVNYGAYYESCLSLLRQGGVIAVDNVLWHGSVGRGPRTRRAGGARPLALVSGGQPGAQRRRHCRHSRTE